jgi:hypothetical protein
MGRNSWRQIMLNNGPEGAILIFNMLDELANELGYEDGAQSLIGEEPAVNMELLQVVQERLIAQAELRRLAALQAIQYAEAEVNRAYQ